MSKMVIEKSWEEYGLHCVVALMPIGHRCGYVGVPEEHPLFGLDYSICDFGFQVHGGITFTDRRMEFNGNLWYWGFDCNHFADAPDYDAMAKHGFIEEIEFQKKSRSGFRPGGLVWKLENVEEEVRNLCWQMHKVHYGGETSKEFKYRLWLSKKINEAKADWNYNVAEAFAEAMDKHKELGW